MEGIDPMYDGNPVLGAVVLPSGMPKPDLVRTLLLSIARAGLPVVVLDEIGDCPVPDATGARRPIVVVRFAHDGDAGLAMGRYLLDLGHRSIAWVSPFHGAAWSRSRHAGVCAAFEAAGVEDAVKSVVDEKYSAVNGYLDGNLDLAVHTRSAVEDLLSSTGRATPLIAATQDDLHARVFPSMHRATLSMLCKPLFERARSLRRVTAWVCASDTVAQHALAYLHACAVPVPAKLSVTGFDDCNDSLLEGLTSYNFNAPALAGMLLDRALHPPRGGGVKRESFSRGYVSPRETVARVR